MLTSIVRAGRFRFTFLFLLALAACDTTDGPIAPEAAPTVVFGRITAGSTPLAPTTMASSVSLAGIVVSTEDGSSSTTTDEQGSFRLEVRSEDGRVRIRFRSGSIDFRVELSGLPEGGVFQIDLSLSEDDLTVISSTDSDEADFDGVLTALSVSGDAPARVAVLQIEDDDEAFTVEVREGETEFDQSGDASDFSALLTAAADSLLLVEIDGEGALQADGMIVAHEIEVELEAHDVSDDSDYDDSDDDDSDDDGDDDANDAGDFSGAAALVEVIGDAPMRTARIAVTDMFGTTTIEVVEGTTTFDSLGDAVTFDEMLTALMTNGLEVEIEGDGTLQADGTVIATAVKVETDGDDDANDAGDFSGAAALVEVIGDAPMRTARIAVTDMFGTTTIEVVEGTTTFDSLGDAVTFDEMLTALMTNGLEVEIEGDGTLQADGTVVATAVKVETDD